MLRENLLVKVVLLNQNRSSTISSTIPCTQRKAKLLDSFWGGLTSTRHIISVLDRPHVPVPDWRWGRYSATITLRPTHTAPRRTWLRTFTIRKTLFYRHRDVKVYIWWESTSIQRIGITSQYLRHLRSKPWMWRMHSRIGKHGKTLRSWTQFPRAA